MMLAPKFTIYHGLAASLALHFLLGLPFAVHGLASPVDEPEMLVVELRGEASDSQVEQAVLEQTKGVETQQAEQAKPAETPPPAAHLADDQPADAADDRDQPAASPVPAPPSPEVRTIAPAAVAPAGAAADQKGVDERRDAETIKTIHDVPVDRLREYGKSLSRRVQAHLVYPDEGRSAGLHGCATVSFTMLPSGRIRADTLKIVASSGQATLDASALKTIRASVPFDPPPREMTVSIDVDYSRRR